MNEYMNNFIFLSFLVLYFSYLNFLAFLGFPLTSLILPILRLNLPYPTVRPTALEEGSFTT